MRFVFIAAMLAVLSACAERPCHEVKRPDLAAQATGTTSGVSTAATGAAAGGTAMDQTKTAIPAVLPAGHILVGKADGSKQCQAGSGVAIEEMEKELSGLKVYNRAKRSDGKMHTQVCGSPTGKLNVFEIDATSLVEAQKRGFKAL